MLFVSPDALPLHAQIETLALDLRVTTGAAICSLTISDRFGQLHTITVAQPGVIPWADSAALTALKQVLRQERMLMLDVAGHAATGAPLRSAEQLIGAVLLAFSADRPVDGERLAAGLQMVSRVADLARQVETLQSRTDEIIEGLRLREIQMSRNLIRGVIDSLPIGLALVDADGSLRAINRALADRFGREPAAIVGQLYDTTIGEWDDSPAAHTVATGQPYRLRRSMRGPDLRQALIEVASFPIFDPAGNPYQVVEVWEDITERVTLQSQLVRAEKLAAIGQLAASIAHEVGNPLQAIQGFLALFLEQCAPDTPNQHFLKLAEEEIDRIVHVLARLRDLYRTRADVLAFTNLNELIESILLLTSKQLERVRVKVRKELDEDLPSVEIVADQVKQVLLNLVLNAAEAMQGGGLLHIQTYQQHDRSGARSVVLTVTDTGVGIMPDQLPYIFDGLHTTKERGMGLGLYTSKAIIERHMGRITAQSTVGEGTTFVITLPVRETQGAARAQERADHL
jgi:PAS domain S-box-containing protein